MTLWEYTAMVHEHEIRTSPTGPVMTDQDMDGMLDWVRSLNLPDVRL